MIAEDREEQERERVKINWIESLQMVNSWHITQGGFQSSDSLTYLGKAAQDLYSSTLQRG